VRRSAGIVGGLLVMLAIAYVVAFRSAALTTIDLDAVSDPRTGELRSVPTQLHVISIAWLGAAASLGLLAIALLVQARHAGGVRVVMRTSAMVAGCFVSGEAAKWILGAAGPLGEGTAHAGAASFPSVHSAVAMTLALGLARLTAGNRVPLACAYAIAMGAFTVLAGWHFPSDVIGGFLLGAAWATGIRGPRAPGRADPVAAGTATGAIALAIALPAGYAWTFGRAGIHDGALLTGALAIGAAALVAGALSTAARGDRKPRPSSGVAQRACR
jgi:undecaprenyl-diphosphatase